MPRLSDPILRHFHHPHGTGDLPNRDGEGWSGDFNITRYMRIQVRVEHGTILDARFGTSGCAVCIACGSAICEYATNNEVKQVLTLTPQKLEDMLEWLPGARKYCAVLAVEAMHKALEACGEKR